MPFEEIVRTRIFEPLGMNSTAGDLLRFEQVLVPGRPGASAIRSR